MAYAWAMLLFNIILIGVLVALTVGIILWQKKHPSMVEPTAADDWWDDIR